MTGTSATPRYSVEAANRANAGSNTIAGIVFAALGGGLFLYLRLKLPRGAWDVHDMSRFSPIVVFPWVIALVGVWFLLRALLDTARLRKFGESRLESDELFVLGRKAKAVVRTSRDLRSDYTLRLSCIRRYAVTVRPGRTEHRDRALWEATRKVEGATIDSSVGIPVEFDIPADQPPADWPPPESDAATSGVRWVLEVTAPTAGLNYESIFRVNVQDEKTARELMEADESEGEDAPDDASPLRARTIPWFVPWIGVPFLLLLVARPDYGDLADAVFARAGLAKGVEGTTAEQRLHGVLEDVPSYRAGLAARRMSAEGLPRETVRKVLADELQGMQHSRGVASLDLGMAGPPVIPWLVDMLGDGSERVRRDAAGALGDIGPAAASAAPALRELANRTPADMSTTAASDALGRLERKGFARFWHEVPFQPLFYLVLAALFAAYVLSRLAAPGLLAKLRCRTDTPAGFLGFAGALAALCLLFALTDLLGAQWTLRADAWALFLGSALGAAVVHDLANRRDPPAEQVIAEGGAVSARPLAP